MAVETPILAKLDEAALEAMTKAPRAGSEAMVGAFKELARRRSPAVAKIARSRLVAVRSPAALRSAAAVALGQEASAANQTALLKALDLQAPLLKTVVQALGRIGDKKALARLEAMAKPVTPADAAALGFAKSLIAYRLRLDVHQIAPAPPARRLVPDPAKAERLAVTPATKPDALAELQRLVPGIALDSGGMLQFRCRNSDFLIVMTAALAKARDIGDFARHSGVMAVVFKQANCPDGSDYALYEYIFANAARGGKAAMIGVRESGATVHSGEASLETQAFVLEAERSLHTNPLALGGSLAGEGKTAAIEAIIMGGERSTAQPAPGAPKAVAAAVQDRPRAIA